MNLRRLLRVTPRTDYGPDESRRGPLRRLTLRTADGTPFLERWALDLGVCGVYVHHLVGPDPGLDLHDHPWSFAAVVLSGAYVDEACETRRASTYAYAVEGTVTPRGRRRVWRRGSVHVVGLDEAHRITSCTPGCWTLVLRGRARRPWGFYTPDGWVDSDAYDYEGRRPGSVQRDGITRPAVYLGADGLTLDDPDPDPEEIAEMDRHAAEADARRLAEGGTIRRGDAYEVGER